jgi:hypothetical protein
LQLPPESIMTKPCLNHDCVMIRREGVYKHFVVSKNSILKFNFQNLSERSIHEESYLNVFRQIEKHELHCW